MALKFTSLLGFIFFSIQLIGQVSPYLHDEGENQEILDHLKKINDLLADTTNIYAVLPAEPFQISDGNRAAQHFPYPIIFIHGLVGSADSWSSFYNAALVQGWTYGGSLRFNLNSDNNLFFCSLNNIADFNTNIQAADFYAINFNCNTTGTCFLGSFNSSQSNQAAIVKQGHALREAIKHVRIATGKNKVILIGHSMGGLAARQYLQNPNTWVSPNVDHYIAKLVTIGTPHGGSNTSSFGFGLGQLANADERSDAVRDLRKSYFYSENPGVFLFGGPENSSYMWDILLGFYNYDVNCNGVIGNNIVGLNQKDLYINLDFSSIISNYALNGDGIVGLAEAQLKNYYIGLTSETFYTDVFHTSMTNVIRQIYEAFDEPDYYHLSYEINVNTLYNGFITLQAADAEYAIDYDNFVFTTSQPGWLNVKVNNIATTPFGVAILTHPNYNFLYDQQFQSSSITTAPIYLPAGKFYLELYAMGSSTSWQHPYNFILDWTPATTTSTASTEFNVSVTVSPNPITDVAKLIIQNKYYSKGFIKVYNALGQEIFFQQVEGDLIETKVDLSSQPAGVYLLTVLFGAESKTIQVIKG